MAVIGGHPSEVAERQKEGGGLPQANGGGSSQRRKAAGDKQRSIEGHVSAAEQVLSPEPNGEQQHAKRMESRSTAEAMEPRSIADGMEATSYTGNVRPQHRAGETIV